MHTRSGERTQVEVDRSGSEADSGQGDGSVALGDSDDDEAMPVPDRSAAGDSAGPARSRHIQDRRQREREQAFLREPRGAAAQRAGSSRSRQPSPTGTEVSPITDCPSREPPPAGQGQHALVAHASAGDSGRDDVGTEVSLDCGHDDTGAEVSREHTQAGESGGQGASPGGARVGPRCCLLCFVCSCACCLFNAPMLGHWVRVKDGKHLRRCR